MTDNPLEIKEKRMGNPCVEDRKSLPLQKYKGRDFPFSQNGERLSVTLRYKSPIQYKTKPGLGKYLLLVFVFFLIREPYPEVF